MTAFRLGLDRTELTRSQPLSKDKAVAAVGIGAAALGTGALLLFSKPSSGCNPLPSKGSGPTLPPSPGGRTWLMDLPTLQAVTASSTAAAAIQGSTVFVGMTPGQTVPKISGVAIIPVAHYPSSAALISAVKTLPSGWWVLYDPESWSQTPASDQANPVAAAKACYQAAHAAGHRIWQAPATDLAAKLNPQAANQYDAYTALGWGGAFAPYADGISIQGQGLDADPATWAAFTLPQAAAALKANSKVIVASGISSSRGGTPSDWVQCYDAAKATIPGMWANVSNGDYSPIVDFFSLLQGSPTTTPPPTQPSAFVKASGTALTLNGEPFTFRGFNYFHAVGDPNIVANLQLSQLKWNVLRCWCYQAACISGGNLDFSPIDKVVAACKQLGLRMVATLCDQWGYLDNNNQTLTLSFYQGGYKTTPLANDIVPYLAWAKAFAARYASEPTIAIVELVNEANANNGGGPVSTAALQTFTAGVGQAYKAIDPNHLLCVGIQDDSSGDYGAQYQEINASPYVDIGTQHDYGYPTYPLGNPTPPNIATAIEMMKALNKPYFTGEMGIDPSTISPATDQERATLMLAKMNGMSAAGAVGTLVWQWTPNCSGDQYKVCPGDPLLAVMDEA